jgi:hypothetical protein
MFHLYGHWAQLRVKYEQVDTAIMTPTVMDDIARVVLRQHGSDEILELCGVQFVEAASFPIEFS